MIKILDRYDEDPNIDEDYKANLLLNRSIDYDDCWFFNEFIDDCEGEIPSDDAISIAMKRLKLPKSWFSAVKSVIEYNL
jgi:hypothetical protein